MSVQSHMAGGVAARGAARTGRVMSVQSHVVRGHCGNKLLGLDVDPVETVQFSNHTGYPTSRGSVLDGAEFVELIDGLDENGLLEGYSHLLTGYVGSPCLMGKVVEVLKRLREKNPGLVYVCDPVIGDNGKLYVKPEVAAMFRDVLVPLATVVTPNQFELEQLTGLKVLSKGDAFRAMDALHALGPRTVVVSSLFLPDKEGSVVIAGSTVEEQENGGSQQFCIEVPKLEGYYTGTGDLFAALSLAWMHRLPGQTHSAVRSVVSTVQAVLRRTAVARGRAGRMSLEEKSSSASAAMELRLVQSVDDIREPPELD